MPICPKQDEEDPPVCGQEDFTPFEKILMAVFSFLMAGLIYLAVAPYLNWFTGR
jgi:hypothetical protein